MIFQVEWQEMVYDAFDEIENICDRPLFEIKTDSLEQAKEIAEKEAERQIDRMRPEGYKQHGMFIPRIIALIGEKGNRHEISKRQKLNDYSIVDID